MSEQSGRHLFLSPHYDDIPLSCGGTVALLRSRGHSPEVALVFGDYPDPDVQLTPFARHLHKVWGLDFHEVIDARRAEEAAAAELIGSHDIYLPFRDAIYRGDAYDSDEAIFGDPVADETSLPSAIAASLNLTAEDKASTSIYAPLAIGRHVDHQIVYLAGLELHNAGYHVRFYEDLPYALSVRNMKTHMAQLGDCVDKAEAIPIEEVWEIKIDAIMAYPSQLNVIFESYVGVEATRAAISDALLRYATSAGDGVVVEQFWQVAGEPE